MDHDARDVRPGTQIGIANYVHIGETRQTKSITDAAPSGAFHIKQQLGSPHHFYASVESEHTRKRMLAGVLQTVGPTIESGKSAMTLKNKICLSRNPKTAFGMRKNR